MADELPDDEEVSCPPPSPVDVARRALILSGVVCRANLEHYTDEEYRQEALADIQEWFDELDLFPHLEPEDQKILSAPFGSLPRRLGVRGTWYVEGLAILAWALRRGDFPPHDQKVNAITVTNSLDFLAPEAAELLAAPNLRDRDELAAAREWFYDVHCTLRGFLHWNGDGHLASWIGEYVKKLGLDPKVVLFEGGLAVDGGPLVNAKKERLEDWECVICERHRAVIWLEGDEEPYTELSVDT